MSLLIFLGSAFLAGLAHGLTPGHGKAIVGAYLVGSRGRLTDALALGAITTLAHTGGVLLIGLIVIAASAYTLPQQAASLLSLIAGVLIVLVGGRMVWHQLRGRAHDHSHDHRHEDDPPQFKIQNSKFKTPPVRGEAGRPGKGTLWALGVSGGVVPCPAALAFLLAGIAAGEVWSGVVWVLVFSLGVACVLTGIGILCVRAGALLASRLFNPRLAGGLQLVTGGLIVVIGIVFLAGALQGARWAL